MGCTFKPVETAEIFSIVRSFRNGKARDIHGLSAEHLKYAVEIVAHPLANLTNFILSTGYIPSVLLEGLLTPVPKKDKDQTLPTNYRGITVLSILGKVLEKVLQKRTEELLTKNQSRLQRGFTKKSSSVNAALLISEVQNEAKDRGEFLSLVTLDAAKAFDVVWQASLLRKIYHEGVDGTPWLTLPCMYSNAITSVKWGPHISSSFPIKQGVRQGGILSTTHYKLFNNGLLHTMDESGIGASIGCFKCGAPTCADDVAVLGNKIFHVRCMVEIVRGYCSLEHYTIHPQKSEEVVLNCEKDSQSEAEIRYGNEPIKKVKSAVHLGVERSKTGRPNVKKKVQLGRRTMYSLMGAGVYGGPGLNPMVSAPLWKIYALPRVLYGLEVQTCLQSDIQNMEQLQMSMLRRIQSFPNSTAIPALYCLLGVRPLEQELDLRRLTLLANVLYTDGTLEQDIAVRQISVKDPDSHS